MRALVLEEFNRLVVSERPDPGEPGPDEVGVQISYTGICGSDIHGYTGQTGRRAPGQVMGHEAVGRIYALGEDARAGELSVGQTVTFNPLISCGHCAACESGSEQHCADRVVIGVAPTVTAAFAERVHVPAANVVSLTSAVSEAHGALVEPLAVALHAARRAGIQPGDNVLVTGGGPIGQSVVLAALRLGAATVLATDLSAMRRQLCESLGATALDPAETPAGDQVRQVLGRPADVAIDAVGISATVADALAATRFGGTIGLVGMGSPELSVEAYAISTEERSIVGSFCYDSQTFRDAAGWVAEGHEVFDRLITRTITMEEADQAFRELAGPSDIAGKVLVDLREV